MSYITSDDLKANLSKGFDITEYLDETDQEVIDVAQKLGVSESEIQTPVHYKIKRYAVVFASMRLAQDKIGTNTPDTAIEKYKDLYFMYKTELKDIYPQLTSQMFTGNVNKIIDRTSVFGLYRS